MHAAVEHRKPERFHPNRGRVEVADAENDLTELEHWQGPRAAPGYRPRRTDAARGATGRAVTGEDRITDVVGVP